MYCRYCILQAYFDHRCQVVFENFEDLEREIRQKMQSRTDVIRFGTGEFGDSLFLENRLGLSQKIAALLEPYPNTLVEFKTKSTAIDQLERIGNPHKVVIGFSLNTPRMIRELEEGTASLRERLETARKCEEMGFWIAFHFDPMVWYKEWESEYRNVIKSLFTTIRDPRKIAWCSMGGFRTMPALKELLLKHRQHLPLFSGEMIRGEDGKLRYFRPVRTAFYRAMYEEIRNYYPDLTLYLCMESREVWEDSGLVEKIPNGLVHYLDTRAREMLGI